MSELGCLSCPDQCRHLRAYATGVPPVQSAAELSQLIPIVEAIAEWVPELCEFAPDPGKIEIELSAVVKAAAGHFEPKLS